MSKEYYYKNIKIAGPITNTAGICSYLTNTAVSSDYLQIGLGLGNYTPFNNITESPSPVFYSITNTDISSYTIAGYISGTGGQSGTTIPSWCTKIRAVLVGGGGGGGTSQPFFQYDIRYGGTHTPAYQQDVDSHNSGFNTGNNLGTKIYHQTDQQAHIPGYFSDFGVHTHQLLVGGGGGGGGGFIYIPTVTVTGIQQLQASAGAGGGPSTVGQNSTITLFISNVTNTLVASAGNPAYSTTGGGGGGYQIPGQLSGQLNGWNGQSGADGSNNGFSGAVGGSGAVTSQLYTPNQNTYGFGGSGGNSSGQQSTNTPGLSGDQGYYKVYYLTG